MTDATTDPAGDPPLFFKSHVFMCMNQRMEGHERGCCASKGAIKLRNYMKAKVKELEYQPEYALLEQVY